MQSARHHLALIAVAAGLIVSCSDSGPADVSRSGVGDVVRPDENSLQEVLERGTLRVGTTGDFYLSSLDPATGKRAGFDIDLVTKLAEDMGVDLEFVATDWTSLVSGLTAGRYDMTTGASYTAGRAREASYTIPIATIGTVALVREADRDDYTSWESMNRSDVVIAVQHGGMVEEYAAELVPDARLRIIDAPASAYTEVISGRADVVLANMIDAATQLAAGIPLIRAAVEPRNANFIGFLIPQGDSELRSYVDAWIRAQECSGLLADLTARYHLDF